MHKRYAPIEEREKSTERERVVVGEGVRAIEREQREHAVGQFPQNDPGPVPPPRPSSLRRPSVLPPCVPRACVSGVQSLTAG